MVRWLELERAGGIQSDVLKRIREVQRRRRQKGPFCGRSNRVRVLFQFRRTLCYRGVMSNLDELFLTPPADLIGKLKALRDDRAGIESKEAIIEQLLDVRDQQ